MNYKPTDTEWLRFALADEDEPREYLQYIYSDGNRLIATNGHVLHVAYKAMDEGYYTDGLFTMDEETDPIIDHKFPNIDKVIPKDNDKAWPFSDLPAPYYKKYDDYLITRVYSFDGVEVNADYLEHACLGFDYPVIQYKNDKTGCLIKENDRLAVVMPIKAKE